MTEQLHRTPKKTISGKESSVRDRLAPPREKAEVIQLPLMLAIPSVLFLLWPGPVMIHVYAVLL